MKYRKKPVVIEAVQWTGNLIEIQEFCQTAKVKLLDDSAWKVGIAPPVIEVVISTLEGDMKVSFRDFVIKGVNGEFYPCKPDIFCKTYEPVDEAKEADGTDEVVRELRQLSVETGSLACLGCGREHNCGTHGCAILRASADLHEQQQARIAELEGRLAASQRREQAAVEDISRLVSSSPEVKCSLVCDGDCIDCVTSASGTPRGYHYRGHQEAGKGENDA
jgi:hypothetical protein